MENPMYKKFWLYCCVRKEERANDCNLQHKNLLILSNSPSSGKPQGRILANQTSKVSDVFFSQLIKEKSEGILWFPSSSPLFDRMCDRISHHKIYGLKSECENNSLLYPFKLHSVERWLQFESHQVLPRNMVHVSSFYSLFHSRSLKFYAPAINWKRIDPVKFYLPKSGVDGFNLKKNIM